MPRVAGDVVTVAYLLTIVSFPIRSIGWLLGEFPRSVVGFRRVSRVIDATGEIPYGADAAPPAGAHGARLEVEHLGYSYVPGQRLLEDVAFTVEPGRTVAIVGATASGKSTLTTLLARLVDPDRGRILIDGVDLRDLDRGQLAARRRRSCRRPRSSSTTTSAATSRWAPTCPTSRCGRLCARPRPTASWRRCRRGSTPSWGSGAPRSPAASGSGSRWPARWYAGRGCWCSTTRRRAVDPEVEARILAALRDGGLEAGNDATLVVVAYRKATIALADEVVHLAGRPDRRPGHARRAAGPLLVLRPAGQRLRARRPPRVRPGRARRAGRAEDDRRAAMTTLADPGTVMDSGEDIAAIDTIRRGIAVSPELTEGIRGTLALAVVASVGQVIVPIVVQQTLDHGLQGEGGPDVSFTVLMGVVAAAAIVVTSPASYLMTRRLFTTSERGLATLRIKAFRHVHDLPLLTQNTERRGALVSRVTSDVDQVSQFLVFGGLFFIVSVGQVLIATIVMLVYSWQLAIVVWVAFAPLFLSLRWFQRKLSAAYGTVRRQMGAMLAAISEPVVGAAVVRSYAVEGRTQARIDEADRGVQGGQHDRSEVHRRLVLPRWHLRRASPTRA